MGNPTAHIVVALIAAGMGIAFYIADPKTPSSRALSLFLVALGAAIVYEPVFTLLNPGASLPTWLEMPDVVLASIAFIAGFEWGLRSARTIPSLENRALGDGLVRMAQGLIVVFALLAFVRPDLYQLGFTGAAGANFQEPGFYLFAIPLGLALVLVAVAAARVWGQRPEHIESIRMRGLIAATPFLAAGLVLPDTWVPISLAIGEVFFLVGAIRYHVMQGEHGQFLSRFLSPQVAQLVREQGMQNAMRTERRQMSVVCCDIRGFTAYAKSTSPDRVIDVLREYYQKVGEAVTQFGGTIKDQAGDGVLILVGAPIPYEDHADRAIRLAILVRERVQETLDRWSDDNLHLGLGIGVASGDVAVGVIGDASRLEYTAVGTAVNLASRLCERAANGEIRIDAYTIELSKTADEARDAEPLTLKGFPDPVVNFLV